MKRALTAVVLIPLVLVAVMKAPVWLFVTLVALLALGCEYEFFSILRKYPVTPLPVSSFIYLVAFFAASVGSELAADALSPIPHDIETLYSHPYAVTVSLISRVVTKGMWSLPLVQLMLAMRSKDSRAGFLGAASSSLGTLYIWFGWASVVWLREQPWGVYTVFLLLILVWTGDIAAYCVGRSVGKKLLAPQISPKKTWEGAAASFVASIVMSGLLYWRAESVVDFLSHPFWAGSSSSPLIEPPWFHTLWFYVGFAAVINIAAQFGDLAESLFKRGAEVKDSGSLLPGHGGLLDRVDALLFAAPAMWYYLTISSTISEISHLFN